MTTRAERLWMELGRRMGWTLDKCEYIVECYDDDQYGVKEEVDDADQEMGEEYD